MAVVLDKPDVEYWYFVLAGGGVESGDTSMDMPIGARVAGTEQEMSMAVDIALDRQREEFETEQQDILDAVAAELGEGDGEEVEDCEGTPINHSDFKGMGTATLRALVAKDIKTVEQLVELKPEGIEALDISRVTLSRATAWYDVAVKIIGDL